MTQELIKEIIEICIIPLLGVLTGFIIKLINRKAEELSVKADNELANKYIYMIEDTITKCVIATNQTYVDALKKDNAFTPEAQQEAFQKTLNAVLTVLEGDAQAYIENVFGDAETYLTQCIEAAVAANK